jgi:flavin reductase (DIM6/NTAB) family NADH-FMN oxidoreductase RutF
MKSSCEPRHRKQAFAHLFCTMTPIAAASVSTARDTEFVTIAPKILYFGTPIAIVSTANQDGSANLAPISSFWALGWTVVFGLLRDTKTLLNLEANPECVINIPSPDLWEQVERLAPLTGLDPVPPEKAPKFRHEHDKFAAAQLTPLAGECVAVPRVQECPAQLEGRVRKIHALEGESRLHALTGGAAVEVEILRVHVRRDFVLEGDYVDPLKWQPLIYNFRHYYGLGEELGKTFRAER